MNMWKGLYDTFLQLVATRWSNYLAANGSCGQAVRNNFQNQVYPEAGIILIITTLAVSLLYYYYLNFKFGRYYSLTSWFWMMLTNSLIIGVITYFITRGNLGKPMCPVSNYIIWMGIINSVYGVLLFFLVSLVLKIKSPMGKKTPF